MMLILTWLFLLLYLLVLELLDRDVLLQDDWLVRKILETDFIMKSSISSETVFFSTQYLFLGQYFFQILHEKIYDEVLERIANAYKQVKIGDPLDRKLYKWTNCMTPHGLTYSWVSLGYFAVNLSGGQPKMY